MAVCLSPGAGGRGQEAFSRRTGGSLLHGGRGPVRRRGGLAYEGGPSSRGLLFLQGFLATGAVLYPCAGQAFSTFGYHPRLIASMLIAIAALASLPTFSLGRTRNGLAALCLGFVVLAFLYADPLQREFAFQIRFDTEYYTGKLARIFQICVPILVLGYLVGASRHRAAFLRGTRCAVFLCGLIGLGVFCSYGEYFLGQTSSDLAALEQEGAFHAIGMSIVISLSAILLLDRLPWKGWDFAWLAVLAIVHLFAILLLRQRAHLIMLVVLVVAKFWSARSRVFSLAAVTIVFALAVGWIVGNYREYVVTETVRMYWQGAADGRMVQGRMDLATQAMEGIRERPMGQGLGVFSVDHFNKYPHNCVLEAFYELGVFGALCVGSMCLMALRQLVVLFRQRTCAETDQGAWLMRAIAVFLLAHVLKSGSLEHIGPFVYFLFITPDVRPARGKSPGAHAASSDHVPRMGPRAVGRPLRPQGLAGGTGLPGGNPGARPARDRAGAVRMAD